MYATLYLFNSIVEIYWWIILADALLSWLIAFDVINKSNRFVAMLTEAIFRLVDPVLKPIRYILPEVRGIDISPIVLLVMLSFVQHLVNEAVTNYLVAYR
jgi:YggT family protein